MLAGPRPAHAAIAVVALFAAACTAATASSSAHSSGNLPTATPAGTTDGGPVTSDRFGWTMEIPAGWRYRPATEDWPAEHDYPLPGARYSDNFEPADDGFPAIDVSTRELAAGQSREVFLAGLDAGSAGIGCTVEEETSALVDGEAARLQRQSCAGGGETVWEVIAFDSERVYAIYWIGLTSEREQDEPAFIEALSTFRFAPAGS